MSLLASLSRTPQSEFVSPLPQKKLQANGVGQKLFLYLKKGTCAVNKVDFAPVTTPRIANVTLSASQKEIILEFAPDNDSQVVVRDSVMVPIVIRDTMIRVSTDDTRSLFISTFDVMRALRMPHWMPPDYMRFPPHHLRHFYRITEHDPGCTVSPDTRYSKKIEGCAIPMYVYSDASFFFTSSDTPGGRKKLWRLPRKPHWKMENRQRLKEQGAMSSTEFCRVGDVECVLKTIDADGLVSATAEELLVSLMMSIFETGPEVIDFWYNDFHESVCLLMKRIRGATFVETVKQFPRNSPQFEAYFPLGMLPPQTMISRIVDDRMLGKSIKHTDLHGRNVMMEEDTGRLIPIDFGFHVIETRPPSPRFTAEEEVESETKRRRVEEQHDRKRAPLHLTENRDKSRLPPTGNPYAAMEYKIADTFASKPLSALDDQRALQALNLSSDDVVRANRFQTPPYYDKFGDIGISIGEVTLLDASTHQKPAKTIIYSSLERFGSANGTRWQIRCILEIMLDSGKSVTFVDVTLLRKQVAYFEVADTPFVISNTEIIKALRERGLLDETEAGTEYATDMDAEMLP